MTNPAYLQKNHRVNFGGILDRLDGVKRIGADRAIARCPAHGDKSPSLSLRETEDGRILVHCFAGCGAVDVLDAIGLELSDLFPERIQGEHVKTIRPNHYHAALEALKVLSSEVLIVTLAANMIARGESLTPDDAQRVAQAATRIRNAAEVCR